MTTLFSAIIGAIIRWGLAILSGYLLKKGVAQPEVTSFISAINPSTCASAVVAALAVWWSIAHKKNTNTAMAVAAATGTTNATPTADTAAAVAASGSKPLLLKGATLLRQGLALALAFVGLSAVAQTNVPAPAPATNTLALPLPIPTTIPAISTNIVSTNAIKVANDVLVFLEPLFPYLNKTVVIDAWANYSGHYFGGQADLQVPINNNLSMGAGGMLAQNQWFAELVSTKLGASYTIPVINRPVFAYVESGMSIPIKTAEIGNLTTVGLYTAFDINPSLQLKLEGSVGDESSLGAKIYGFGASLTWKW